MVCFIFIQNTNYSTGLEQTEKEITAKGGESYSYVVDVSSWTEVYRTTNLVQEQVGKIDILINNAGIFGRDLLVDQAEDKIVKCFQINVLAHYWVSQNQYESINDNITENNNNEFFI